MKTNKTIAKKVLAKVTSKKVQWKPIKGFEGMYQINKLGQVKSLDRVITTSNGQQRKIRARLMTICKNGTGVMGTSLTKDGIPAYFNVDKAKKEYFKK